MSISSGYDKFKDYHQTEDGSYKLTSRWTSSNTVELDDGSTVEEKFTETDSKLNNITDSILDTMEEIEANTQDNQLAGALALKELSEDVTTRFEEVVAKADVIDNLVSTETNLPLSANQGRVLSERVELLKSKTSMDLLWENPSPTSNFLAQTISLDLSSYKYIILNVRLDAGDGDNEGTNIICLKELTSRINSTRTTLSYRYVTVTDAGVKFSDARSTNTLGSSATVNNNYAIPYRIYGIKS